MTLDLARAASFLAAHGRVLDRRRLAVLTGAGDPAAAGVLDAVASYRNADGGFGWGLEPDLRAPESQPAGALHALEAIADTGAASPVTAGLLDWLDSVTLPDGGLPLALPVLDPTACSPFWVGADPATSSVQITAAVAAQAHRAARAEATVRMHPWLGRATSYCLDVLESVEEAPPAYVLRFALQLLEEVADTHPRSPALLDALGRFVPHDGVVGVEGGAEGETLHLLDLSPRPGSAVRELLDPSAVERDLDRLEAGQRADGGWTVDFVSSSPAAALEWRGHATVAAVATLRAHGR